MPHRTSYPLAPNSAGSHFYIHLNDLLQVVPLAAPPHVGQRWRPNGSYGADYARSVTLDGVVGPSCDPTDLAAERAAGVMRLLMSRGMSDRTTSCDPTDHNLLKTAAAISLISEKGYDRDGLNPDDESAGTYVKVSARML
jgi:hypothetical protein